MIDIRLTIVWYRGHDDIRSRNNYNFSQRSSRRWRIELDSKIDEEELSNDQDRDSMTKVSMILHIVIIFHLIQLKKSKESSKPKLDRSKGWTPPEEKRETAKFGPSGKSSEVGMFDQNPSASDIKSDSKKQCKFCLNDDLLICML